MKLSLLDLIPLEVGVSTPELLNRVRQARGSRLSQITLTRELKLLIQKKWVLREGKGRAVRYRLSPAAALVRPVDCDEYFKQGPDDRRIHERFQFGIFDLLNQIEIFSSEENERLEKWIEEFHEQKAGLSPALLRKEFERVTIELSWKSSAIEGNTYSLLETETLIKEGIEAPGKRAEEARMILNHKTALDFVRDHCSEFGSLSILMIEKVHALLVDGLEVNPGFRKSMVGITGTRYRPIENIFQIREVMDQTCALVNGQRSGWVKAFLAILLISYIQPFEDGNKRTSRIISNALLLGYDGFPLSFRSVNETEYKKAILLFYEQNNITAFKKIFLEQAEFAVKNYFRSKTV